MYTREQEKKLAELLQETKMLLDWLIDILDDSTTDHPKIFDN